MSGKSDGESKPEPTLLEALTSTYAELVKRQRTASAAFVRWASPTRRAHEFAWVPAGEEAIIQTARPLVLEQSDAAFQATRKMAATVELNPFEREILYGYPYVIGYREGVRIRGVGHQNLDRAEGIQRGTPAFGPGNFQDLGAALAAR